MHVLHDSSLITWVYSYSYVFKNFVLVYPILGTPSESLIHNNCWGQPRHLLYIVECTIFYDSNFAIYINCLHMWWTGPCKLNKSVLMISCFILVFSTLIWSTSKMLCSNFFQFLSKCKPTFNRWQLYKLFPHSPHRICKLAARMFFFSEGQVQQSRTQSIRYVQGVPH